MKQAVESQGGVLSVPGVRRVIGDVRGEILVYPNQSPLRYYLGGDPTKHSELRGVGSAVAEFLRQFDSLGSALSVVYLAESALCASLLGWCVAHCWIPLMTASATGGGTALPTIVHWLFLVLVEERS